MAKSDRLLIRLDVQKAANSVDDILVHLKNAADRCGGRSELMNNQLPIFVSLLAEVKQMLLKFRFEL
jgi:hypothetical protein